MKQIVSFLLVLLSLNLSGQSSNLIQSRWNEDGAPDNNILQNDWSYLRKGRVYYFISNDDNKIYVSLKIQDPAAGLRILREGLKLWINMDNRPEKNLGIHFPLGAQNQSSGSRKSDQQESGAQEVSIINALSKATAIELIGFKGEERKLKADNPDSFTGAVSIDSQGSLLYNMVLPVEKLPVRNSRDGVGAMPFSLGIEYGTTAVNGKKTPAPVLVWIKSIKLATDK